MKLLNQILLLGLVIGLVYCEDTTDSTITTTTITSPTTSDTTPTTTTLSTPSSTTDSTTTISTSSPTTTSEPSTTTSSSTNPTTTTISPTTTSSGESTTSAQTSTSTKEPDTTTTTTLAPTTTEKPDKIFNFTIPKNSSQPACLRAKFSLTFNILYGAEFDNKPYNSTAVIDLSDYRDFDGECNEAYDTLEIIISDDWKIVLNYTLKNNAYELDNILFNYTINQSPLFPNASSLGKFTAYADKLNEFSANKGNSYKCTSDTKITLNNAVSLDIRNYQAQAFLDPNTKTDFDTAIECSADTKSTSKLVPIIVGSALAVLVVLVLVAYIIGRRKHRPGYQQV